MSDNLWDAAGYLDDKIAKLRAENADLQAEVDKLRKSAEVNPAQSPQEIERLKAEIAELKNQPDPLTAYLYAAELAKDEVKRLKAEVEALRQSVSALTEAGDDLWYAIRHYGRQDKSERLDAVDDWLYAKDKANRIP